MQRRGGVTGRTAERRASWGLTLHTAVHIIMRMAEKRKRKNPAAVALGRRGGARSRINLTPEQRTELARRAAAARWAKAKGKKGA